MVAGAASKIITGFQISYTQGFYGCMFKAFRYPNWDGCLKGLFFSGKYYC
jgi:hypothetical protein